jgi:hypothetical protein
MESDNIVQTVTSEKPKNKGRVEWGRKLGKMSKDRKKLKQNTEENTVTSKSNFNSYVSLVAVAGAVIAIGFLYFRKNNLTNKPQEIIKSQSNDTEKPKAKSFPEF